MIYKKQILFFLGVYAVIFLSSCSSPKALTEIVKSDYVEEAVSPYYTNPKSDLVFFIQDCQVKYE